jgi:hypothetical protein
MRQFVKKMRRRNFDIVGTILILENMRLKK